MMAWCRLSAVVVAFSLTGLSHATQPERTPGLLPVEIARPLLDNDPAVSAARAGLVRARADARGLRASPYEWTAQATGQQREIEDGRDYDEWNLGIERTIRLPGKAAADRKLASISEAAAEAAYGEAIHEAARDLAALWVDWLAAERAHQLAATSVQFFEESLAAVDKRTRAGDASRLDLGTARAELVEQRRLENDAKTAATIAWNRLATRFPGLNRRPTPLPMPLPIEVNTTAWRERILSESDELKIADVALEMAQAEAARARADRVPDPTLAPTRPPSSVGARNSGPYDHHPHSITGRPAQHAQRQCRSWCRSVTFRDRSGQTQYDAEIASAFVGARGAYDSLQIASEGAAAMHDNAALIQRAYALGEVGLQDLLIARRHAASAADNALRAQAEALHAYYGLVIDAHWVWDLEHESIPRSRHAYAFPFPIPTRRIDHETETTRADTAVTDCGFSVRPYLRRR